MGGDHELQVILSCRAALVDLSVVGLGWRCRSRLPLPVRAEELEQDGGDYLGRGVVIVSVEHLQARPWRGGGLLGDRALEPARAVGAAENEDGRGDLPQLGRGYPAGGDGEVVGERGGQGLQGCYPRGAVHLREHLTGQPDDLGPPERNRLPPPPPPPHPPNILPRADCPLSPLL